MTLEEKRKRLACYCNYHACEECVLKGHDWIKPMTSNKCLDIIVSPEVDIDKALELIAHTFKAEEPDVMAPEDEPTEEKGCFNCLYECRGENDNPCNECRCTVAPLDPEYKTRPFLWAPEVEVKPIEEKPTPDFLVKKFNLPNDPVNKPGHYTVGEIECIDAIKASMSPEAYAGFLKGNAIKYLWRYQHKGKPVEDLKKANWYLDRLTRFTELREVK